MKRRNWLEVNLNYLADNYWLLKGLSQSSMMPIIKANAYAHGAIEVAKKLVTSCNCQRFGVADILEAVLIRQSLAKLPSAKAIELVSLSPLINRSQINHCLNHQIIPVIPSVAAFEKLIKILKKIKPKAPLAIWLKINTGMNRLGIKPALAKSIIQKCQLQYADLVKLKVLITHLSSAEEQPEIFTNYQIEQFNQLIASLDDSLKNSIQYSIGNSAFLLNPEIKQFDHITRSGLSLYGVHPFYFEANLSNQLNAICQKLKPTASLKAKIIAIDTLKKGEYVGYSRTWQAQKQTQMATLSIGYADGYPRHTPSGTKVLLNGQIAHLIGRVSMDTCSIDITGIDAKLGDTATLYGDGLDVNEIAKAAQTIPYEILTRTSARGGIVYLNDQC